MRLLDKMSVVIAGAVNGTPTGGDDAVARHISVLRSEVRGKDEALKRLTEALSGEDQRRAADELKNAYLRVERLSEQVRAPRVLKAWPLLWFS